LKNSGQLQLFGRGAKKVGTSETGAGQFFFWDCNFAKFAEDVVAETASRCIYPAHVLSTHGALEF
jgi:hypothetical protein